MKIKSEKGLTLTTVIIYIIGMVIMATIIGTLSVYFYSNVIGVREGSKNSIEYSKFNMYFLEDIKRVGNRVSDIAEDKLILSDGNIYSYKSESGIIYRNGISICENITDFSIKANEKNGKIVLEIFMKVNDNPYTTTYVVGKGY